MPPLLKEGMKQPKQDSVWATQESQPGLVLNPAPRGHLEGEEVQHTGKVLPYKQYELLQKPIMYR